VQTLQGLKAAFQEANCVFRADPHHRDMVIEFFIAGLKAIRLLKGRNDPFLKLKSIFISYS
jgi:hypothetical protein